MSTKTITIRVRIIVASLFFEKIIEPSAINNTIGTIRIHSTIASETLVATKTDVPVIKNHAIKKGKIIRLKIPKSNKLPEFFSK